MTTSTNQLTVARLRAMLRGAGHRSSPFRSRLSRADRRERKAAGERLARTLAAVPHFTHAESFIFRRAK